MPTPQIGVIYYLHFIFPMKIYFSSESFLDMSNLIQCQSSEPDEESSRTILVLDSSPARTHPVPVAETYSMASVNSPEISDFTLVLPKDSQQQLSAPQLKAIKYACCQNEKNFLQVAGYNQKKMKNNNLTAV